MRRGARSRSSVTLLLLFVMVLELLAPLGALAQTGGETAEPTTETSVEASSPTEESPAGGLEPLVPGSLSAPLVGEEASDAEGRERRGRFMRPALDELRAKAPKDEKDPPEVSIVNMVVEDDGTIRDLSPKSQGSPAPFQQSAEGELAASEDALADVLQGGAFEVAQGGHVSGNMYVLRGGAYYDPSKDGSNRPLAYNCYGPLDSDISVYYDVVSIVRPETAGAADTTIFKRIWVSPQASDNGVINVEDGSTYTAALVVYYKAVNRCVSTSPEEYNHDWKLVNYQPGNTGVAGEGTNVPGYVASFTTYGGFGHYRPGVWQVDKRVTDTQGRNESVSDTHVRRHPRVDDVAADGGYWQGNHMWFAPKAGKTTRFTGVINGAASLTGAYPPELAWIPKNPAWKLHIKNSSDAVVRTLEGSVPNTTATTVALTNADGTPVQWDGKDSSGVVVPDGAYQAEAEVILSEQHTTLAVDGIGTQMNLLSAFTPILKIKSVLFTNSNYAAPTENLDDLYADNGETGGAVAVTVEGAPSAAQYGDGGPFWVPQTPTATVKLVNLADSVMKTETTQGTNQADYLTTVTVPVTFVDGLGQLLPYGAYVLASSAVANGVQSPEDQSRQTKVGSFGSSSAASGGLQFSALDFALPGRGVTMAVGRSYDSGHANQEPYFGWKFSFDARVRENQDGSLSFKHPDGSRDRYTVGGPTGYQAVRVGNHTSLSKEASGAFKAVHKGKVEQLFDPQGRLTRVADTAGNGVDYSYDANGRLTKMTDPSAREVLLAYDGSGRLTSVSYDGQVRASYAYTGEGWLDSATLPGGTTKYFYDTNRAGRLYKVRSPLAQAQDWDDVVYGYDVRGRITSQTDPSGLVTTTTYFAPASNKTEVKEGTRPAAVLEYDSKERITKATDPAGNFTLTEYADSANPNSPTRVTNARGYATNFTYDARGNLSTVQDVLGRTTTIHWDPDWDKPTRIVGPSPGSPEDRFTYHSTTGRLVDHFDPANKVQHYDYEGSCVTVNPVSRELHASPRGRFCATGNQAA